jgi:hypothetical protein
MRTSAVDLNNSFGWKRLAVFRRLARRLLAQPFYGWVARGFFTGARFNGLWVICFSIPEALTVDNKKC